MRYYFENLGGEASGDGAGDWGGRERGRVPGEEGEARQPRKMGRKLLILKIQPQGADESKVEEGRGSADRE